MSLSCARRIPEHMMYTTEVEEDKPHHTRSCGALNDARKGRNRSPNVGGGWDKKVESGQSAKHGQPKKGSVRKQKKPPKEAPGVQCAEPSLETEYEPHSGFGRELLLGATISSIRLKEMLYWASPAKLLLYGNHLRALPPANSMLTKQTKGKTANSLIYTTSQQVGSCG